MYGDGNKSRHLVSCAATGRSLPAYVYMATFFLERLERWEQKSSLREACGLRWRSYMTRRNWNAYMVNRVNGTWRPAAYILIHDDDSRTRTVQDVKLLENLTQAEFSEILSLLSGPITLRINPLKILEREDYETMAALKSLGAAKDVDGVYRIGTGKGRPTGVEGGQVFTKEQLLGSR